MKKAQTNKPSSVFLKKRGFCYLYLTLTVTNKLNDHGLHNLFHAGFREPAALDLKDRIPL
jgi:hypothetical protein